LGLVVSMGWLRNILRRSSFLHQRQTEVSNVAQAIDLMRRFYTDDLHYDLEWDDFISWKNPHPRVELARKKLEKIEWMLFSKDARVRSRYNLEVKLLAQQLETDD
jgi:hypothetical protein